MPNKYVTFIVTLNGNWQQLTLQSGLTVSTSRSTLCKSVSIQADPGNSNPAYVAGVTIAGAAPSGTNFGIYIPTPVSSIPTAPLVIGDSMGSPGGVQLESIYVKGTNAELLHINVVTYP